MVANFRVGVAAAFGLLAGSAAFAENPIIQTYYSPDPAPVVFGDTLCSYSGNDEGGSFFTMHGWRVSCTTDMVNWTDMGELILEAGDFGGSAKKNGDWAAQVIRRKDDTGKYKYYYYVTVESTRGGRAINVAVSDKKEGPFKDALGGKHLAGPNWDYIDPTVWIDDDGQAYLYWGNPKLYFCPLKDNMIECKGDVQLTDMASFNGKYTEGPWIHKRGSKYYMIYAAGGVPESIDYSWSDKPTSGWEYKGIIMPSSEPGSAFTVHSGIVDFQGRSFFFYHNQRRVPGAGGYSRTSAVEEFTWGADGTIPTIRMSDEGVTKPIKNLDPYERVEAETKTWTGNITLDKSQLDEKGSPYTIIKNVKAENGCVYLTNMNEGFYTKVSFVDMSDGVDRINVVTRGNAGKMELHMGSETGTLLATLDIPASTAWEEHSFDVTGAEGVNNLYFVVKQGGFDFDYWYFETDAQKAPQEPYSGTPIALPGKVQAEDYDKPGVGRENKSYYDADAANQGGAYREDGVDIVALDSADASKGYAVGYTQAGEWMEYSVKAAAAGNFKVTANVATGADTSGLVVLVDDKVVGDTVLVAKTGEDWSVYKEVEVGSVELAAGEHVVKILVARNLINIDWVNFDDPNAAVVVPPADTNTSVVDTSAVDTGSVFVKKEIVPAVQKNASYEVFSVTGKHLGRVEMVNGSVVEALKMAGFRPGLYMVRNASGAKMVNTAK